MANGVPELLLDGKPVSRMWGRLDLPAALGHVKLEQYREAGIDVYFTALDAACSLCWDGGDSGDSYDFAPYLSHIERLVRIKDDIRLILYVGCTGGSPYLWSRRYGPTGADGDNLT